MNSRTKQAKQILASCRISQTDSSTFTVQSCTTPGKSYTVSRTGHGLICECPDHQYRKSDCKHIKAVLYKLKQNKGYANAEFRIMERSKLQLCKFCDSGDIIKAGMRKGKTGNKQMFKCRECNKRFSANFGFEHRQTDPKIITQAIQMYYQGMSVRDISDNLEMTGIDVCHKTVYNWIANYSDMVSAYLDGIIPRTIGRNMVRADEVWIKVSGEQKYLFASMDDDTRYWLAFDMAHTKFQHNADTLLELTRDRIGSSPKYFVTDGLPAYSKSSKKVFGDDTNHIRHIHLNGDMNNNKMERLNGEIRDREKVFRGLKKIDTPILKGMQVYYNFTKKHGSLNGKTPAEQALIKVDGKNKWFTLIQNASLNRITE